MTVTLDPPATASALALDPFAFWPGAASRVDGLGGDGPSPNADVVFHTAYTALPVGKTRFEVGFEGLVADGATLTLHVNALPTAGGDAVTVGAQTFVLSGTDAALSIEVDIANNFTHALLATITQAHPASARAVTIVAHYTHGDRVLDDAALAAAETDILADARQRLLAAPPPPALARFVLPGPPTLARPVSQMCTAAQFDEPAYREWTDALRTTPVYHRKQWEFIYVLQALKHYGVLVPGSRGLGFGVGREPLPALFASIGCQVVATDLAAEDDRARDWRDTQQHIDSIEMLRRPDICDDARFEAAVSFRAADMTEIPADLRGFDFTWSSCAYEHLGSIDAGLTFVEASLDCLREGGVAVHTTEFNLSSNDETIDNEGTVLFRRRDFEALAMRLIAAGHEVMPLCYDIGAGAVDDYIDVAPYSSDTHLKLALGGYVTTSFGIIVRKGRRRNWVERAIRRRK